MIPNSLKIVLRNIMRHKAHSFINILGLAIGLTCCILILLFVQDEVSFDRFHHNAERLYRLDKVVTPQTGGTEIHAITSGQMGPAMVRDFPEVEQCTRLLPWFDDILMTRGETTFKVSDVVFADSTFFTTFDFKLLHGDPRTALSKPMSIVLSEQTARKFFGDDIPVGESIVGFRDELYTVTGIIEDVPSNSHVRYNALISWSSTVAGIGPLEMPWMNNWLTQVNFTYLLLGPGADASSLEEKFPAFMERHFAEKADQYQLFLQPFNEIYLQSSHILFTRGLRLGNGDYVYAFSAIALLILLIACVNFMNLSTARAAHRAKEVGVRKVLGADRRRLASQFLAESMLFSLAAMFIAAIAVEILFPAFSSFTGKELGFNLTGNLSLLGWLTVLTIVVGYISGTYPALVLSRFQPVRVLKGMWTGAPQTALPRKILVTAQFSIAIALIAGTLVIYQQMKFTQQKNLGFEKEQIVVLPTGDSEIGDKFDAFKNELLQNPHVLAAAGCNSVPGQGMMSFGVHPEGKPETEDWTASSIRIDDFDLLKTYGMSMAKGRYFSRDFSTDATNGVVINETLARSLGWDDPIGKEFHVPGEVEHGRVIGVIKDFHMKSFHYPIEPTFLYYAPRHGNLSLRITSEDIPATIEFMRQTWERFDSRYPFEYYFLDRRFDALYASDQRMMQTFTLFSILAVFVSALGLLGLASYAAEQRTKEIGIRKVLGATISGIVVLLSREFLKLVLFASLLAVPLAWLAMTQWLQDFAYRTEIGWWVFVFAGGLALVIALLTIGTQAIRAARANPVAALRYE